ERPSSAISSSDSSSPSTARWPSSRCRARPSASRTSPIRRPERPLTGHFSLESPPGFPCKYAARGAYCGHGTREGIVMTTSAPIDRDTERLESLGYRQELSRVLGFFDNFSVAFTYLSPLVGIFSLFVLGVGTAGPAYIWLMPLVVVGMLFVA